MRIRFTLAGLLVIVGALPAVAVGAALVVLLATGLGALLSSFLPFTAFEATLLSLIATVGVLVLAGWLIAAIARTPSPATDAEDDVGEWEDDEEDWLDEWEDDEEWDEEEDILPPGSRPQPYRRSAADQVGRNDPCPCGSGKKYKNCHGKPTAHG